MRILGCLLVTLSALLGGCANFKAVADFAHATKQAAAPIREEMDFLSATCIQQAGLRSGFERDAEFKRVVACRGTDQVLQTLQRETLDVMDLYAAALLALADDKKFDLSPDIEATTRKLAAIKTGGGTSPVSEAQAGALGKVLSLIADAWAQRERAKGIKVLVDASDELAALGKALGTFFKAPGDGDAPYAALVRLTQAEAGAVNASLRSTFIVNADPIRAAELRLEQWKVNQALAQRASPGPGNVGTRMAQTLEAWVDSIPAFREQALKPDRAVLYDRIRAVLAKAIEARDAAKSAF